MVTKVTRDVVDFPESRPILNINIESGNINGTSIGLLTPNAGSFTNLTVGNDLTVNGNLSIAGEDNSINGITIGMNNPAPGFFTTLTATNLTVNNDLTVSNGLTTIIDITGRNASFSGTLTVAENAITGSSTAVYSDLAERYHADKFLEPGTVIELGGENEITDTKEEGSVNVFGVISTQPGFMMNSEYGDDTTHPYVALIGRVPVKIIGKCKKGNRLISSNIPGVAKSIENSEASNKLLAIIGRALFDKNDEEVGLVEAVIGIK